MKSKHESNSERMQKQLRSEHKGRFRGMPKPVCFEPKELGGNVRRIDYLPPPLPLASSPGLHPRLT